MFIYQWQGRFRSSLCFLTYINRSGARKINRSGGSLNEINEKIRLLFMSCDHRNSIRLIFVETTDRHFRTARQVSDQFVVTSPAFAVGFISIALGAYTFFLSWEQLC